MSSRTVAVLALFGVAVIGFAVYLLVEVHATPAHAQTADPPHPVRTTQAAAPAPVADAPTEPAPRVQPTTMSTVVHADTPPQLARTHGMFGSGGVHLSVAPNPAPDDKGSDGQLRDAMTDANKAYDNGDVDDARARAEKIIASDPNNVRMLRIVTSVACLDGDQTAAQKAFDALPRPDKEQMKIRCARSGVTFNDPAAAAAANGP